MHKLIHFLGQDKTLESGKDDIYDRVRRLKEDTKLTETKSTEYIDSKFDFLKIKQTIGIGSHAVVKLAIDIRTGIQVAVKFYDRIKLLDVVKQ